MLGLKRSTDTETSTGDRGGTGPYIEGVKKKKRDGNVQCAKSQRI